MPSSLINKSDFYKVCRICLQTAESAANIHESTVLHMFASCAALPIHVDDGLPSQICQNCYRRLTDSFQFKRLCEDSHRTLLELRDAVEFIDGEAVKQEVDEFEEEDAPACESDGVADDAWLSDRLPTLDPNRCGPNSLTCKACNKTLPTEESLLRHVRTCRPSDDASPSKRDDKARYKCEYCELSYCKISSLGKHVAKKHAPTPIPCTMCHKKFAIQLQLETHMKFIHRQQKEHRCAQCGKVFQKNHQLMRHQKSHATERIYHCMQCDKSFRVEATLRIHYRVCHSGDKKREVCTICGKAVYRIKQHLARVHTDERVTCPECGKEFNNKHYLEEHRKRKHGDPAETTKRPHLCSICGKGSVSTTALKAHHQHMHTVGKTYPCPICNKKFKTDQAVNAHVRYTHNHQSRYTCTMCSKTFQISSRLKIHMRVHTGERPCVCKLCGKGFGESSTLKKHMRVHGFDTTDKAAKHESNELSELNEVVASSGAQKSTAESMQRFLINI